MFLKFKFKNKIFNNTINFNNFIYIKKKKKKYFLKIINTKNLFKKISILRKLLFNYIIKIKFFNLFFKKINLFFFFLNIKKNIYKKKIKIFFKLFKIIKKIFLKKHVFFYFFFFFKKKILNFFSKNYFINTLIFIIYKIKLFIFKNNLTMFKKKIKSYKILISQEEYQKNVLIFKNLIYNYNYCENKFYINFNWKIKNKILKKKNKLIIVELKNSDNCLKLYNEPKKLSFIREYDRNNLNNLIRFIILDLPKREQKIIRLRFGIGYSRSYTLEEIGLMYYLTKERIRQIELNIFLKLRQSSRLEVLKPYLRLLNTEE
ncbi:sigma factor-like helix-turn-helix DNA-binding protein [Candidatus Carsonella ruddii]|uniref:Putative RNA polymerase sigma factor rpoD n=1 Tax=Candidatus Carsonella ruddii PC isolate NHV TaxID=1202540 RepID=J3VQP8_CARRU|nr:sigma factor-like helix-turn-helix DNA-binding protein [Candidatus Carsonella ruddii]AFP84286.1 putative RNA polymerase sigma factor rpoD [Candidatus Carsonella ruddii PC isolate NHV]